jgi:hypothetical protein
MRITSNKNGLSSPPLERQVGREIDGGIATTTAERNRDFPPPSHYIFNLNNEGAQKSG